MAQLEARLQALEERVQQLQQPTPKVIPKD